MILQPSSTRPTEADDATTFIPQPSLTAVAKIEDTIELVVQESEAKATAKVNKWHEKFAKSRLEKKDWELVVETTGTAFSCGSCFGGSAEYAHITMNEQSW